MANITPARCPTGPVPAKITAVLPCTEPDFTNKATMAAAVVLLPLLSSMIDTRKLLKNFFLTAFTNSWPASRLLPLMKIAVKRFSLGGRVKIAPSTKAPTFSGVTPPYPWTWSAPPSWATTVSNTLGNGSVSK